MKAFTTLRGVTRSEIDELVDSALRFAAMEDNNDFRDGELTGRAVAMMFFEASTRTRLSFELATRRLGAHPMTFDPDTSSAGKGESLRDTVLTVSAIGADIIVVRHSEPGIPDAIGDWTGVPVVNAGDGTHEHPTQALLDVVTLRRRFGSLEGLRLGIIGDIRHSRVAGSLFHVLPALGVDSVLIGPESLLPDETPPGFEATTDLETHLGSLDVLYLLRVQNERGTRLPEGFVERYRIDARRAASMSPDAAIMHPGPMNRGVEIVGDVADGPRSLILEQVANGVPTRMAVLTALADAII